MKDQKTKIPEVANCYCGANAKLIDWDFNDKWRVMCDKNHTLTRPCGTMNRAAHRWNARVALKIDELQFN